MSHRRPLALTLTTLAAALFFSGAAPAPTVAASTKPTLFLVGDSTVNSTGNGIVGWGTPVAKLFDPDKITVKNLARGGRSARSYYSEGLWTAVKDQLKPGDFVLFQFGHNDGGDPKGANSKGRPDLPGLGDDTTTAISSAGKEETVHTYGWYMKLYLEETKAKGATPIMLTMIPHNAWTQDGAKIRRSERDSYVKWCHELATTLNIPYIDLNEISTRRLEAEGKDATLAKYFNIDRPDGTHTSAGGAQLNAECVVMGIRALKDLPLNNYLSDAGKKLDPAAPEVVVAPKPSTPKP